MIGILSLFSIGFKSVFYILKCIQKIPKILLINECANWSESKSENWYHSRAQRKLVRTNARGSAWEFYKNWYILDWFSKCNVPWGSVTWTSALNNINIGCLINIAISRDSDKVFMFQFRLPISRSFEILQKLICILS